MKKKKRVSLWQKVSMLSYSLFFRSNSLDFASPSNGEGGHIHIYNEIFDKMDKERKGDYISILIPNAIEDSVCRSRKCV